MRLNHFFSYFMIAFVIVQLLYLFISLIEFYVMIPLLVIFRKILSWVVPLSARQAIKARTGQRKVLIELGASHGVASTRWVVKKRHVYLRKQSLRKYTLIALVRCRVER